ncbi:hypothetical protein MRY82_05060 [bacterium]|nr:hypothetical protein [bacterium]
MKSFLLKAVGGLIVCFGIEPSFAISGWEATCSFNPNPKSQFMNPRQPGTELTWDYILNRKNIDLSHKEVNARIFVPSAPYLLSHPNALVLDELNPICWEACSKYSLTLEANMTNAEKLIINDYTFLLLGCEWKDDSRLQEGYKTVTISKSEWDDTKDFLDFFSNKAQTAFSKELALTLYNSQKNGLIEWVKVEDYATFRLSQKGQDVFQEGVEKGLVPYPEALQFRDLLAELKPKYFSMNLAETRFVQNLREVAPAVISVVEFNPVVLTAILSLSSSPNPPYVIAKDPAMLFAYHKGIQQDVYHNTAKDFTKARNSIWDTIYALKAMITIVNSQ